MKGGTSDPGKDASHILQVPGLYIARTRREGFQTAGLKAETGAGISRRKKRRALELNRLLAIPRPFASEVRCFAHADLANRFDLPISVPGIGERAAIALLVRVPNSEPSRMKKWRLLPGLRHSS
ncbi:MAG: hypothetical protein M3Z96_08380 [Pseudomonadota bacterium]|nr:hypothetical protein [Pseudomonadota bacterium]